MVTDYPFHANLVAGRVEENLVTRTLGVTVRDGSIRFLFNPSFVCNCSFDELVGVLHHEVNHLLFGHIFIDPARYPDRDARLIAEEVTANEFVTEPLPGEPITLIKFQLPPDECTDTRYMKLIKRLAQKRKKVYQERFHQDRKTVSEGRKMVPEEQKKGPGNRKINPQKQKKRIVDSPDVGSIQTLDDHDIWSEVRREGAVGRVIVKVGVQEAVRGISPKQWEKIPSLLRMQIHQICCGTLAEDRVIDILPDSQGAIDWRQQLRKYISGTVEIRPIFNRHPRRFPELVGIVPGYVYRPEKARVMAVIDTSGSISPEMLNKICGELDRMSRSHKMIIVECDAVVHATYSYSGSIRCVKGRGGTDLRPPFKSDILKTIHPDVIVYFTDGFGSAPDRAPRVPVIWCVTASGEKPAAWGREIRLDEE